MAFGTPQYINSDVCGIDYGTDADIDGVPAAYTEIYAKDIEEDLDKEFAEVDVQKSDGALGPEPLLVGGDRAVLKFKTPWRSGKTAAHAAGDSLIATLGQYAGMDLHDMDGGVGKITGGSATTMTCLDADDPGWTPGDMIILEADGDVVMRQITKVVSAGGTTTLTLTPEMPGSPQNGEDFYPTDTLVPSPSKVATYTAFDVYRGEGATDRIKYQLLGGAMSALRLAEVAAGGIPWAEMEYVFGGGWGYSGDSRAHAEDVYDEPLLFLSDRFYLDDGAVHLASMAFDVGLKCQPLPGQTATGIQGFRYLRPEPKLNIKPLFDSEYITSVMNASEVKAFYSRVYASNHAWGIGLLNVQFSKAGAREDYTDGVAGAGVTCRINDPGYNDEVVPKQLPMFALGFSGV